MQPSSFIHPRAIVAMALFHAGPLLAHPLSFNSTVGYSSSQPSGSAASISNWTGAAFDAANIGGSGVNADGGANNGAANDASTYVANDRPRQGQTFTTGSHVHGYDLTSVTARMAGYTGNTASGTNTTAWNLNRHNGPVAVEIGRVNGTDVTTLSKQNFIMGGTGTPGAGNNANGAGSYLTFHLPFAVHLEPDTTYAFDFWVGNGSGNHFEWLGISTDFAADPYAGGTAYTRAWWGGPLTPLAGERVFMADLTPSATAHAPFVHPGALHTQADFDRMTVKVAANAQPWKTSYDALLASPFAQTWWGAYDVDYINRGGAAANNYTRSQQDAQAIYQLSLRWKLTGDTAYADRAVQIANVWSGLLGVTGDTNASLASGICGYLFAIGGEILSTYPGWPAAQEQAYKDMMMRVFYPANLDFLWRHHDTPFTKGGNTHYRLNWDTANMASMAAIGILCDNQAVYQQAVDYFKNGTGNGNARRAAWYIHPDGTAQTEESGRDQPHNMGGWYAMGLLCQMAWNQGDDLFGHDNNRVLRAYEYNARYNLWNEVPWVFHRNASLAYTETLSGAGRGLGGYPTYELIHNHYANVKGIATPWSKRAMDVIRPEGVTGTGGHPSAQDCLGLGSLTFARDATAAGTAPSGLSARWSKNRVLLNWWGTATATSYRVQRATSAGGPFTTIGTAVEPDLHFTDTHVINGTSYHYKVVAVTPSGDLESTPLPVNQALVAHYTFEGNTSDTAGTRHATAMGGMTAPGYAAGFGGGQAISLNGADQYVQLPAGSGSYRDVTLAAWVYWNGGNAWQRVFDFGSEIEKYLMLTVRDGSGKLNFSITTSRGTDGSLSLVGPTMPTATWTHVAVTFNGDTTTLYMNGVPVAAGAAPMVAPVFSQPFCYLGRSLWNADALFNGRIDDFRIYNHALSGSDVYSLWGQSANSAPVFSSDPILLPSAAEDAAYTGQSLAGNATDANGGTPTFSKITGPAWLVVASNGTLSGTPSNSDVGANLFVVRVTDSSGATDDANLSITVANTNDAPTWLSDPLLRPSVTRDQPYLAASLAADASDVDGGATFAFSKVAGPAWLTVALDGTLSGTPGVGDAGSNNFTVRVTDNAGASDDATLPIVVLPFEMRAHLAFEDNTADSLGNFAGIATGSPAYATGRLGRGIVLDGGDDHVSLPAAAGDSQDITITSWVFWNGGAANQRVFDFGNNTSQYLFLSPNSGGLRFAIKNGGGEQQMVASTLGTGQWVHVAVTLGGSSAKLYVNGVLAATNDAISIHPGDFKPVFNYIGKSQWPDPLFNGRIDDFRIYNHALSGAEIADMANPIPEIPTGLTVLPRHQRIDLTWAAAQAADTYTVKRSTTAGGPYTVVASGVTGTSFPDTGLTNGTTYYYVVTATNEKGESAASAGIAGAPSELLVRLKFDETGGTVAADASGNGYPATTVNGPTWISGQIDNALNFPGASQYATLPAGVIAGVSEITLSSWVKVTSLSNWARVFDFGTGTNNYLFLAPQYTTTAPNAAKMRFAIRTPSVGEQVITSSAVTPVGSWFHVAVTISGNTSRLYLDGVQVGENTAMTLTPASLGSTHLNYLGRSQFADPYFNGALDDFRIYTRALDATEVSGLATLLPAPSSLVATAGSSQVSLAWNAVPGASSYTVKRATAAGGPYLEMQAGIATTSFTDTGVTDGTTYYYVVSASNPGGNSPDSDETSATPLAAPAVPVDLLATAGDTNVALTWSAAANADSYQIERATTPGGSYTTLASGVTDLTYADTGLTNGTSYYYVVSSVNAIAESAHSTEAAATPVPPGPDAPASFTATPGNGSVSLAWAAAAGADSYTVKRATAGSGPFIPVASGLTGTSHPDTDVAGGTTYYYVVAAVNLGGESDSAQVSATTFSPPPAPWGIADIGSVGITGSVDHNAGTYTVSGSGTDIWGSADGFHFVSQSLAGDGEIRARVTSQSDTDPWAKAGVMIRDGSGAGAVNALVAVTPANGFTFQWRAAASGSSAFTPGPALNAVPNNWVRLTRSGTRITAYVSANGTAWTQAGTTNLTLPGNVLIGLAVTSHNSAAQSTATFDNVTVTPYPSPWSTADIGTTGLQGSAEFFGAAHTVKGAGSFGGTSDGFRYVYQPLNGNGSIVARVSALQHTGNSARVGIMLRDTLAANARMAALAVNGSGAWRWQRRTSTGGNVSTTHSSSGTAPNLWVRLVRSGNTITASRSTNGSTWTTIGSSTVTMAGTCHVGLAVASGSTATLNTSVLDNVTVTPALQPVLPADDADGDGLPDPWEALYYTPSRYGPADDPDADGQTNGDERVAGTSPTNASDVTRLRILPASPATFDFSGKAGRSYILERMLSSDAADWEQLQTVGPLAADGVIQITDPSPPADRGLYRLQVDWSAAP